VSERSAFRLFLDQNDLDQAMTILPFPVGFYSATSLHTFATTQVHLEHKRTDTSRSIQYAQHYYSWAVLIHP